MKRFGLCFLMLLVVLMGCAAPKAAPKFKTYRLVYANGEVEVRRLADCVLGFGRELGVTVWCWDERNEEFRAVVRTIEVVSPTPSP